jgi:hypothetical protein
MRPCEVCGNDIEDAVQSCPFCGSAQRMPPSRKRKAGVETVNLERGLPNVEQAMARMEAELMSASARGVPIVRLIHGYGSSGQGGGIRSAAHRRLAELRRRGLIRDYVPGDDYEEMGAAARRLLARMPALRESLRSDRLNPGITFVELPGRR